MSKQINSTQNAPNLTSTARGWLTWWTIPEGELLAQDVHSSAIDASIPSWMSDRISGRTHRSAWLSATQLGAKGTPSQTTPLDPPESRSRYLSRSLNEESRAIVRETIDPAGEVVTSKTLAVVYLLGTRFEWQTSDDYHYAYQPIQAEIGQLMADMESRFSSTVGKVDSGRIRALVLAWLQRNHRVCVRGTGGVYFVPMPPDDFWREQTEAELRSLHTWITSAPVQGLFSIVELHSTGATTMDTISTSAIEEIKAELTEVDGRLTEWSTNTKMNAGSRMFSSDKMIERLDQIEAKQEMLQAALGEEMGVISIMLEQVRRVAAAMRDDNALVVNAAREARRLKAESERQGRQEQKEAAQIEVDDATCPGCGRRFKNAQGVARHKASCKSLLDGTSAQRKRQQKVA